MSIESRMRMAGVKAIILVSLIALMQIFNGLKPQGTVSAKAGSSVQVRAFNR